MADLIDVLPNFDLKPWRHLTFSLEKKGVLTAELIALEPVEIAKKCPLPLKELRRLIVAVTEALHADLGYVSAHKSLKAQDKDGDEARSHKRVRREELREASTQCVRTLDASIDSALGGGFPTGRITEIVGESAVGKTQFVLGLLLSAQLLQPQGLGRPVVYLSTESSLNTTRLVQILDTHSCYKDLQEDEKPSLNRIFTMDTHDLEAQEHIVQYQLPEMVRRYRIGLIVMDSVAANFRAEFQGSSKKVLSERAVALVKLGNVLRKIATEHDVAIVVTNQVADRFDDARTTADKFRLSSQPSSSMPPSNSSQTKPGGSIAAIRGNAATDSQMRREEVMSLDFQQRFFTGWGDNPSKPFEPQKTPALGLTWANQIDARIALKMAHTASHTASESGNVWSDVKRKRSLSVVFAPWIASGAPVSYTLEAHGPMSVSAKKKHPDDTELLDPSIWDVEDEEFP